MSRNNYTELVLHRSVIVLVTKLIHQNVHVDNHPNSYLSVALPLQNLTTSSSNHSIPGPERVEVFYFEQGGSEYLCSRGGEGGALAQWARRALRRADRCFAELLAVPTCLALLPVSFALHVFRLLSFLSLKP